MVPFFFVCSFIGGLLLLLHVSNKRTLHARGSVRIVYDLGVCGYRNFLPDPYPTRGYTRTRGGVSHQAVSE